MPQKRKRPISDTSARVDSSELPKRTTVPNNNSSRWAWVGTEVVAPSDITPEHRLMACGLSKRNNNAFCINKFAQSTLVAPDLAQNLDGPVTTGDVEAATTDMSNDGRPVCTPKACRNNPNCLNYLGQDDWEDEENATKTFMKFLNLGKNPNMDTRENNLPVGLKNLGATCYVNAFLQVWFRDLAFRSGIYKCEPCDGSEHKFKESPIYQLQVAFAALQRSNQSIFNPTRLIESLQLRTGEQQDAQEFSKLFMSHLDAAFRRQAAPEVKSLVTDQFQGKQVFGTICNNCQYSSEKVADFLEIEINLEANSTLEDRITAFFQPETLSGDNRYLCSHCDGLQDATRYTELRNLPPVLHFSLLRFVYEVSSMERKKSKHAVSFPLALDMGPFLASIHENSSHILGDNMYELRGILLHKGSSAYHGHYEAQVYDTVHRSWFRCSDENITNIKLSGEKRVTKPISTDLEVGVIKKSMSSRDAYMLVYARKSPTQAKLSSLATTYPCTLTSEPPKRALDVVYMLNKAHDEACDSYNRKKQYLQAHFKGKRAKIIDIYRMWNVQSIHEDAVLVSRHALGAWLSQYTDGSASMITDQKPGIDESLRRHLSMDDILCEHGRLSPIKACDIKRISRHAYGRIVHTGCKFEPMLTVADICDECVRLQFQEYLYKVQHPQMVRQFDAVVSLGYEGYWISKPWVKDWRLMKPKMHTYKGDPAPDSPEFRTHVWCQHEGLSSNTTRRQKISVTAAKLLQRLYPSWNPIPTDVEPCPLCDALVHISKENKRELQRQAEEEKTIFRHIYDNGVSGDTSLHGEVRCAIIPATFVKSWKQWVNSPTEVPKPTTMDNVSLICEHDMLLIDPNCPTDLDSSLIIIPRSEWDMLETIYSAGPLIAIERRVHGAESHVRYSHEILVCRDCRMRRQLYWTSTSVTIHLEGTHPKNDGTTTSYVSYSESNARQSRRLRQRRELGEKRRLTICKSTTIKEIKVMVQSEFDIPTTHQQLFYHGKELDDNMMTVSTLGVLANETLHLRRINEIYDFGDDMKESSPREEGRGFEGVDDDKKSCPICTLISSKDATNCAICSTPFV